MGKSLNRAVIIGAAPFDDAAYLAAYLREDDVFIAADGGQRLLQAMGKTPHRIIGDFDSSRQPTDAPCTVLPVRKDDTDVLAALRLALDDGYREFLLLGCLGGRFDHTLANVFLLQFLQCRGAHGILVDENHEISLLSAGEHTVHHKDGYGFSLFPYGGNADGVTIKDALYTTEKATFDTAFPIGVSNGFIGKPAHVCIESGHLLLVLAKKDVQ
ncbi:MAG: thiamine diphosphokinase [Clostridia bacterium]|nr:thiamine diphosphokinase [Clostridia bacterium]